MADPLRTPAVPQAKPSRFEVAAQWLENHFEALLFSSRWLAAPIYFGLIFGLVLLLIVFFTELLVSAAHLRDLTNTKAVMTILDFIDIALVTNLLLIVILAGYEHFVSKIDTAGDVDRPGWMSTVDFSGLKLKLFASIIGITGIELLKEFMDLGENVIPNPSKLGWMLAIHVTFLFTALLSSLADWLSLRGEELERALDTESEAGLSNP
jgi:uncharacterized protein (TIGR00645 family)